MTGFHGDYSEIEDRKYITELEINVVKKLVIGMLAHVDAGKTTLSESILYTSGAIRKLGRVDNKDAFLDNNDYGFKATGSVLTFDGYLKVYGDYEDQEDTILPDFKNYKSGIILSDTITKTQHFTKPPARFTESSLIKELESLGIGRPSTYATIISTIKDRGYVTLEDKKFVPTEVGFETTDKLQEFFSSIVNVKYTANMEKDLDEIADGNEDYKKMLREFYDNFAPLVDNAFKNMEKKKPEETGEKCPECGNPLVIRKGRYGEFVACSNYPECKYIKKEEKENSSSPIDGYIVLITGRPLLRRIKTSS